MKKSTSPATVFLLILAASIPLLPAGAAGTPANPSLPSEWINTLHWRCIGPANMGGRITDLAVYEADPSIWWVATASGGLLKTTNNGMSFVHQFDHENTVSVGDVAVTQSDPNIVWVGTGEENPRNSVSWGDGVYKSVDGGKTWQHMGLKGTFQIGHIEIHPTEPNVVYVAALGRLWGPNEERGLFKTVDGGKTWEKILYIDDKTGAIDVRMNPNDPGTLIVATWERERDGYDSNTPSKSWGPGSGIYKTTDGGKTFRKIIQGLPACALGRIGLNYYRKDPNIVFAVIESEKIGQEPENAPFMGIRGEDADVGARLTEITQEGPAEKAGLQVGDIVISIGETTVHSYNDMLKEVRQYAAGDTVKVEVSRNRKSVVVDLTFEKRPGAEGGPESSGRRIFSSGLGGQRENIQDQQGKEGQEYGGVYRSADGGESWARINSVNPRPMYFSKIRVDPSDSNFVYVLGISLYSSKDGGLTFDGGGGRGAHPDHHAMWIDPKDGRHIILGNDGGVYVTYDRMENWDHLNHMAIGQFYHVGVGPRRNYRVYGGLQDNGCWGGPNLSRSGAGPINEDWIALGGGDGFICRVDPHNPDLVYFASQNGGLGRYNLQTGEAGFIRPRAPRGTRYRFNWMTPYILSNHNPGIYYCAGNCVFRSVFQGNSLKAISPEISNTDRGSGSALAESHFNPDVLYVGTDDGALLRTRDGGHDWENLFKLSEAKEEKKEEKGQEVIIAESAQSSAGTPSKEAFKKPQAEEVLEKAESVEVQAEAAGKEGEAGGLGSRIGEMFRVLAEHLGKTNPSAEEGGAEEVRQPEAGEPAAGEEASGEEESKKEEAAAPPPEDPLSGEWAAKAIREGMPEPQTESTLTLKLEPDGKVTGHLKSQYLDEDIRNGRYDPKTGSLTFCIETEFASLDFQALIKGPALSGTIDVGGGTYTMGFEARRVKGAAPGEEAERPESKKEGEFKGETIDKLMPNPRWVSSIEPSRHKEGRVYITFDGHRSNDDEPYVFVSEDSGDTWFSIRANLPASAGSTRVIREDIKNPNILYIGTEFSAWISIDRGCSWTKLNSNLPTVAVHEFAQHPTSGEIVAATHGRSLWILDVTALRQMTGETASQGACLYKPNTVIYWKNEPSRGGDMRRFVGENPPSGAQIFYSLNKKPNRLSLKITQLSGETIKDLTASSEPGLHLVSWDLRRSEPEGGPRRYRRGGPRIEPGKYLVVLAADNQTLTQELVVEGDPDHPNSVLWGEEYDEQQEMLRAFGG